MRGQPLLFHGSRVFSQWAQRCFDPSNRSVPSVLCEERRTKGVKWKCPLVHSEWTITKRNLLPVVTVVDTAEFCVEVEISIRVSWEWLCSAGNVPTVPAKLITNIW